MKTLSIVTLGIIMSWLILNHVNAQQYTLTPSLGVFNPVDGGTLLHVIETDDEISEAIDIGFTFNFFSQNYTQLKASSNGFLAFDHNEFADPDNRFGAGASIRNIIAPLWDDIGGQGGQASYLTTGVAPNRVFTMEWLNWRWRYNGPVAISFQVSLHESTNEIKFTYQQEPGVPLSPSASIGIVGTHVNQFFSLSASVANPEYSPSGSNSINQKPATGQIYSFLPSLIAPIAPTTSASNISATLNSTSGSLSWTNGDGAYRAVFMKQTSEAESITPLENEFYTAAPVLGDDFSNAGNEWFCVYNGSGNSVAVSNLQSGQAYRIQVCEYNGLAQQQRYRSSIAVLNPVGVTTIMSPPSEPVSTVRFNYVSSDAIRFNLQEGDGTYRAIFIKPTTTGLAPAMDNVTYTANSNFGLGSQIGNSGWFCVYNGAGTSNILVTGLQPNTAYKIHTVDYNGTAGQEIYNTSSEGAAKTFNTFPEISVTYDFQAVQGSFVPISGATIIPEIEADDQLTSARIPIGFTFYFNGIPFTETTPSSNGFISFNPYIQNSLTAFDLNLLRNSFARPLLAPLWDDIDGINGQASYITTGTAPNRVFTIEFLNWQWNYQAGENISFQIKLYEAGNRIEYIYQQEPSDLVGAEASIGMAFHGVEDYASLTNSGPAPTMQSDAETTNISGKPATGQIYSFSPAKLDQTITFNALTPIPFAKPKPTIQLQGTSTSGLTIVYESSDPTVATVADGILTIHKVGETIIKATQPGNFTYNSAVNVEQQLVVTIGDQVITFPEVAPKKYNEPPFSLNATSSSGLTILYESSDVSVATINDNKVTIVGVGTTSITARQSGNENFNVAADVQRMLTVNKGDQNIIFDPLPGKLVGDDPFQITASSNVGLPVSFMSSNNSIATITGNTVTIVGHGIVTITASQSGNANYNAATLVEQMLKVHSHQSISFLEIPAKILGDQNFTLSPTASSGLTVQLTTLSDKITLTNGVVSLVSPGSVTITANQPGDEIFFAAPAVDRTFCINPPKPTIQVSGLGSESPVLQSSSPAHNQWFKDGVAISGQTNNSITPSDAGLYTVKVVVDGCSSEPSDPESLVVTGLNTEQDEIRIFPNPSREKITVDVSALNLQKEVPIAIADLKGQELLQSSVRKSVDIDITKLATGNYLILIKQGSRAISKEFVKH